jgi:hypothetical protein
MVPTTTISEQAPCGAIIECEIYEDRDEEVLITQERCYSCGCMIVRHEYHDGSVALRVVHHDGTVLSDNLLAAE